MPQKRTTTEITDTVRAAVAEKKPRAPRKTAAAPAATRRKTVTPMLETFAAESPVSPDEIARLAYSLWEQRGRVDGSADEDWFAAERTLCRN